MALIGILQQLIARPYNNYNTQLYHQNKWNNSQALDDQKSANKKQQKRDSYQSIIKTIK